MDAFYFPNENDFRRWIKEALGFKEHLTAEIRKNNDAFYSSNEIEVLVVSTNDEKSIYDKLIKIFDGFSELKELKVLIDYTSMSRLWYSGILHFLRLQEKRISVSLNYSLGEYEMKYRDISYKSINSLPSHEGALSSNNKTLLVLAIGFSPYLIKSVIEEIEPNEIIGVLPLEDKYKDMSEIVKSDLTKDIDDWMRCPIDDLETIFRTYAEIAKNNVHKRDLIFLSLGPQIFTIASILVSQRFEQVTCLYLRYSNQMNGDVKPTGSCICNKVIYEELRNNLSVGN